MTDVPDLYPSEPASVRLMNTVWADRSGVHDALRTTEQLRVWWSLIGFGAPALPSEGDLAQYRELRASLRRIAAETTHDSREHARTSETALGRALETVNARLVEPALRLEQRGEHRFELDWPEPGTSVSDHVTSLAREAARLLGSDAPVVRACYGPGCVLYFVQRHTRREWCSPGCGNRARVARHYRRARGTGQVSAGAAPEKRSSVQANRSATAGESSAISPTWSRPV